MWQTVKVSTTVPLAHVDAVRDAMASAGAGVFGNYSKCSFSYSGEGRFLPNADADPRVGQPGVYETVEEVRIEMHCAFELAKSVVAALEEAHPYEEVIVEVTPLISLDDLP